MSKAVFREHFEQIWNNKDVSGIERFIAPNYRGFDADHRLGVPGADASYLPDLVRLRSAQA